MRLPGEHTEKLLRHTFNFRTWMFPYENEDAYKDADGSKTTNGDSSDDSAA